ncbi:MAG: TIGR02281 family clan AA aspartic protease [Gammaproteobacteria bacterium]|nr:MAG: TIGR02281 family clan AA aspartic protease [Gammaproteobacteria bacterium]
MIAMGWLLALAVLAWWFQGRLDAQRNPNRQPQVVQQGDVPVLVLKRNRQGHYVASGTINGMEVEFLLDTGATDVAVPESVARRAGLDRGAPMRFLTANGVAEGWSTRIGQLSLGPIRLEDVRASINPAMHGDQVLLGMSFLRHLDFEQRGDRLLLRPRTP